MAALGWLMNLDFAGGAAFIARSRITTPDAVDRSTTVSAVDRTCVVLSVSRTSTPEDE